MASLIETPKALLISTVVAPVPSENRTDLRTPGQFFCPEKSVDFTSAPSCATSIQASSESVI